MRRLERQVVASPLNSEHTLIQALLLIAAPEPATPVNRRTTPLGLQFSVDKPWPSGSDILVAGRRIRLGVLACSAPA